MGLAVYPAPSVGGAAFPGAGSLVASAYTTKLWWSTTLSAGTYIFYGIPSGSPSILRDSPTGYDSNRNYASISPSGSGATGSMFGLGVYNQVITQGILENSPAVFKLSSTAKVQISCSWKVVSGMATHSRMWRLDNGANHGQWNSSWQSGVQSDYLILGAYNRDGNGYRNTIVPNPGPEGFMESKTELSSFHLSTNANEGISVSAHLNGKFWIGYGTGSTSNKFYSSTDGFNFSNISPTGLNNSPTSIGWSGTNLSAPNANYVVVSDSSSAANNLASSTDGVTWTTRNSSLAKSLYGVAYGAGKWVVVGNPGACTTSADGITWTSRTMPANIPYYAVLWNPTISKFLAWNDQRTASVGNAALSTDGITWTSVTIQNKDWPTQTDVVNADKLASNTTAGPGTMHIIDGEFVTANNNGWIYTSSDGINWSFSNTGLTNFAFYVSPTYGPCALFSRTYTDDYGGQVIAFPQPAIYQVYSSSIV